MTKKLRQGSPGFTRVDDMVTIDISNGETKLVPRNWSEVAGFLGASPTSVTNCRQALGEMDAPLTEELVEEIRKMLAYCRLRNNGGGARCTRHEYVRLRESGEISLVLEKLGII